MKKFFLVFVFFLFPLFCFAQSDINKTDVIFRARVLEILEQKDNILLDGAEVVQQNLKLRGIDGDFQDLEFEFIGIGDFDVLKKGIYKINDEVLVAASFDDQGNVNYYITDYVRQTGLLWLFVVFVLFILFVGGIKGVRSLISLLLTFFIIIKFIIPQILNGSNPVWITFLGSLFILFVIIYITEGFESISHISVVSIFISLTITIILSYIFILLTHLSGFNGEEMAYLINIGQGTINFRGLLLAGVLIGTLGVLDDVVIAQVATVQEIIKTNQFMSNKEVFKSAYRVGVSHISSMTNTLFLAYAGVSLPLLILFVSGTSAFTSFGQAINNEIIATEIVRTLTGSIGLILAVPISTIIATWWFKVVKK